MLISRLLQSRHLTSVVEGGIGLSDQKGRYQNWKNPVYYAPHVHPLEMGPDFSRVEGETVHVTSRVQLDYKLDQLRLAKKIVQLLKNIEDMETAHREADHERSLKAAEIDELRPKLKGTESIS